jgi:hypothetical protein
MYRKNRPPIEMGATRILVQEGEWGIIVSVISNKILACES